jgi:hypothetical protein
MISIIVNHWVLMLCCVFPLWFLQNCIHELSHGLTLYSSGCRFKIVPYPSKYNKKWYFAICHWTKWANPSNNMIALMNIMPRISNFVFIALSYILMFSIQNQYLSSILFVFVLCNLVDFCTGLIPIFSSSPKKTTDIWRFLEKTSYSKNTVKVTGIIILALLHLPLWFI